jgi:hypothetical protein
MLGAFPTNDCPKWFNIQQGYGMSQLGRRHVDYSSPRSERTGATCMQKSGQASRPISRLAFGSPAKLAAVVSAVNEALERSYPMAIQKLRLYLAKPRTRTALLKPIKSNIVEAHRQIRVVLQGQYSSEEAAAVPLHKPEELEKILGGDE